MIAHSGHRRIRYEEPGVRILLYLTCFCWGSWGLVSGLFFPEVTVEILLGMLAPWAVGCLTVYLVKTTFRKSPEKLTALMTKSFFGKMLIYALYIGGIVTINSFQELSFVISFTAYFILLHVIEAFYFRSVLTPIKS